MMFGGILALLVAQVFGKNAKTDAFFAAYGVYAVGLTFGQTFRLTAVSRLVHGKGPETITRLLGAVTIMALAAGIPMVVLANPLGGLLVTTDPGNVAPTVLRILWIALVGQLLAAMLATVLAVRGRFTIVGIGALLSGFVSIGTFIVVESSVGVAGAAIGLAVSAAWMALLFGLTLLRGGWRADLRAHGSIRAMASEAVHLTFASATFIGASLAYLICVAVAARLGSGDATLFAYAYALAAILVGVTANVAAMVRSPALVASRERAKDTAAAGLWSFRFTLVLAGPVLAMAILVGRPLVSVALGSAFKRHDIDAILATLLCLSGWILASAAGIFAVVELLARSELRRLALLAVGLVTALAALAIAGGAIAGIEGVAAALSVSMLGASLIQLRWAFPSQWRQAATGMARATAREVAVLAFAFAPSAVLLASLGEAAAVSSVAGVLAALLAAMISRIAWPGECGAILGLVRSRVATVALRADTAS
jgi:peptidoglycan biosynthesis protein MviN/MurJ (putative lipid II flippase)